MEKAAELLRQKGIASADKKMGRIAAEGVVATYVDGKIGAMVEMNCETDFVAKNENFKNLANMMAEAVAKLNPESVDAMLKMDCPVCKKPIDDVVKNKSQKSAKKSQSEDLFAMMLIAAFQHMFITVKSVYCLM